MEIPRPILPKSCKKSEDLAVILKNENEKGWMTIDPLEIARQMTLIEFSIYEKIQAKECIGQAWNGKKKHIVSPNISAVIAFTNQISAWVATKILESEDIRVRYSILKYFVTVAKCCYDMNNFNTSNAILAAMESSPVHRLKKTWEAFNSDKKNKAIAYYGFSFSFFLSPIKKIPSIVLLSC